MSAPNEAVINITQSILIVSTPNGDNISIAQSKLSVSTLNEAFINITQSKLIVSTPNGDNNSIAQSKLSVSTRNTGTAPNASNIKMRFNLNDVEDDPSRPVIQHILVYVFIEK